MTTMSFVLVTSLSRYMLPVLALIIVAGIGNVLIRGNKKTGVIAYVVNVSNGDTLALRTYETSIGRSKSCDIVLGYDTVSRFHAVIARRHGKWILFDTNSKTGTFVNKDRVIVKKLLEDGDTLIFGNAVFRFYESLPGEYDQPAEPKRKAKPAPKAKAKPAPAPAPVVAKPEQPRTQARYRQSLENRVTGEIFGLDNASEVLIGRADEAKIHIDRPSVSRYHALLSLNAHNRWIVEDLDSTAGTLLNSVPLKTPTPLRDGDIIEICGYTFRFNNSY